MKALLSCVIAAVFVFEPNVIRWHLPDDWRIFGISAREQFGGNGLRWYPWRSYDKWEANYTISFDTTKCLSEPGRPVRVIRVGIVDATQDREYHWLSILVNRPAAAPGFHRNWFTRKASYSSDFIGVSHFSCLFTCRRLPIVKLSFFCGSRMSRNESGDSYISGRNITKNFQVEVQRHIQKFLFGPIGEFERSCESNFCPNPRTILVAHNVQLPFHNAPLPPSDGSSAYRANSGDESESCGSILKPMSIGFLGIVWLAIGLWTMMILARSRGLRVWILGVGLAISGMLFRSSEVSVSVAICLLTLPPPTALFALQHRAIAALKMSALSRLLTRHWNSATYSGRYLRLTL
jgi:hypothetical protein